MFYCKNILYLILFWIYLDNAVECSVIPTLADFSAESNFYIEPIELNDDNIRVGRQVHYIYDDNSCEDENINSLQAVYQPQSQVSINQQQTQINTNGQQQQQQIYLSQNQQSNGQQIISQQMSPSIADLILRTRILFTLLNSIPIQKPIPSNCQTSCQNDDLGEIIFKFPIRRTTPNPHCYANTLLQNPELLGLWQQIIKICGGNPQLLSIVLQVIIKSGAQAGIVGGIGKDGGLLGGLGSLLGGSQSGGLLGGLGGLLGGGQNRGLLGGLGALLGGTGQTGQQDGLLGGLGHLLGGQGGSTGDKGTHHPGLPGGLSPIPVGSEGGLLGGLEALVNGPVKDGSNGLLGGLGGILGGPKGITTEGGLLGGLEYLLLGSPYGLNYANNGVLGDLGGLLGGPGGTLGGLEKLLTGNKGTNGGVLGDLGGILGGNGYKVNPVSDVIGSSEINRRLQREGIGNIPLVGGIVDGALNPVTGLSGLGSRRHVNNENHVSIEESDNGISESNVGLINNISVLGIAPKTNVRRELEQEYVRSGSSDSNAIQKEESERERYENMYTDNQEEIRKNVEQTENLSEQQTFLEKTYSNEIMNNAVQENNFKDEEILREQLVPEAGINPYISFTQSDNNECMYKKLCDYLSKSQQFSEKSKNNKRKYRRRKYKVVEPINVNEMEEQETQIQKTTDDMEFNIPMDMKKYFQMKHRQCMLENMGNVPLSKENIDRYYASISSEY